MNIELLRRRRRVAALFLTSHPSRMTLLFIAALIYLNSEVSSPIFKKRRVPRIFLIKRSFIRSPAPFILSLSFLPIIARKGWFRV